MPQQRTDRGNSGFGAANKSIGTTTSSEVCEHCGQPLHQYKAIEDFLGKIGFSDDMIANLKTQMQNVDVEEYLDTAREYLRTAGEKVKPVANKAKNYAKENPGKIAAGVAVLAVGAGLLINSLRERD